MTVAEGHKAGGICCCQLKVIDQGCLEILMKSKKIHSLNSGPLGLHNTKQRSYPHKPVRSVVCRSSSKTVVTRALVARDTFLAQSNFLVVLMSEKNKKNMDNRLSIYHLNCPQT